MTGARYCINAAATGLVAAMLSTSPAAASGDIICDATDGSGASISIGVGHLPVLSVLNAFASDGVTTWSTNPTGDEKPIVFGQGFADDRQVLVDFTDPNIEGIVVSLRLFQASGGKDYAEAGVLTFEGVSAFPVQCING